MFQNRTYAVIVGINTYDAPQVPNLRGARNDAIAWWRLCVNFLRVPAEQVTVLASPALTAEELGPQASKSRLFDATHGNMVEAIQGLANKLSDGTCAGLLTYSGHGTIAGLNIAQEQGKDLALCPQDIVLTEDTRKPVDKLIQYKQINQWFAGDHDDRNLTAFLDTCYTGTSSGSSRSFPGQPANGNWPQILAELLRKHMIEPFCSRLILGAEHGMPAYEICVDNTWRGAASFAVCSLLEQWARARHDDTIYVNVSYHDLLYRARVMIDTLGLQQIPIVWGPRRVDDLAFLKPGMWQTPGQTSPTPDGRRKPRQIPIETGKCYALILNGYDDDNNPHPLAAGIVARSPASAVLQWTPDGEAEQSLNIDPNDEGYEWWLQPLPEHRTPVDNINRVEWQTIAYGNLDETEQAIIQEVLAANYMDGNAVFEVDRYVTLEQWIDVTVMQEKAGYGPGQGSDFADFGIQIIQGDDDALTDLCLWSVSAYVQDGSGMLFYSNPLLLPGVGQPIEFPAYTTEPGQELDSYSYADNNILDT